MNQILQGNQKSTAFTAEAEPGDTLDVSFLDSDGNPPGHLRSYVKKNGQVRGVYQSGEFSHTFRSGGGHEIEVLGKKDMSDVTEAKVLGAGQKDFSNTNLNNLPHVATVKSTADGTVGVSALRMVWDTSAEVGGTSYGEKIGLPLRKHKGSYDIEVDWGDGTRDKLSGKPENMNPSSSETKVRLTEDAEVVYIEHDYGAKTASDSKDWGAGTRFTVRVAGDLPYLHFREVRESNHSSDNTSQRYPVKVIAVETWSKTKLMNTAGGIGRGFDGCVNLITVGEQVEYNSGWTTAGESDVKFVPTPLGSLSGCFESCYNFNPTPKSTFGEWDTSGVNNMSRMFFSFGGYDFNADITGWDTSGVKSMRQMFHQADSFDRDIGKWNVSNVKNMYEMLAGAVTFNQGLSNWDVSSATTMEGLFLNATEFNNGESTDVEGKPLNWGSRTSSVGNMKTLFKNTSFNQDISDWDVSSCDDFEEMFRNAPFDQDLSFWDVTGTGVGVNMKGMFQNTPLNQNLNDWNVSNVTDMKRMFKDTGSFQNGGSGLTWGPDAGNVTTFSLMFMNSVFNQPLNNLDASGSISLSSMFKDNDNFNQEIGGWVFNQTSGEPPNFGKMFKNASSFNNGGSNSINGWDVSNGDTFAEMFKFASNFSQELGRWHVSQIIDTDTGSNYYEAVSEIFQGTSMTNELVGITLGGDGTAGDGNADDNGGWIDPDNDGTIDTSVFATDGASLPVTMSLDDYDYSQLNNGASARGQTAADELCNAGWDIQDIQDPNGNFSC